ncbi:hypothetical protein [Bradyrhizobium sp. URHD0069]|uniref:hypothetical protein n=1 Tax=Bradyrhizobium sp. URHD0069 TaxID=1380355 RepID=UPI001AEC37F5|nr:hypothetical protein [Bradyrhizobium sp. URHD0069]
MADLAQILLDRLTALGTRHAESGGKALCIAEVMIAHPDERQVDERHEQKASAALVIFLQP